MRPTIRPFAAFLLACSAFSATSNNAAAHGGVVEEDDLCIIKVGYYRAHFKVYLPEKTGLRQYCEDLPYAAPTTFIMEYEHEGLSDATIDFRIVENVTGHGRFTQLEHIEAIEDLDAITVFHRPDDRQRDIFTVMHRFERRGDFVGIVTISPPDSDTVYTAVFPFAVGFTGLGWWPLIVLLVVVAQVNYWWMSGRFRKPLGGKPRLTIVDGGRHA